MTDAIAYKVLKARPSTKRMGSFTCRQVSSLLRLLTVISAAKKASYRRH